MKIAIVTGASSGMGREMVFRLADRYGGFQEIWVIGRRKERLDALDGKVPVKLRKFPLDLTKKEDLEILAAALAEKKPEVRFLVNAAGFGITGPVGSFPEEEAASMVRLNCEGLTAVTELVLPYIPDNSRILQFASAAAFMPQPGFAVYAATKAYVLSYSRALGEELRRRRIFVTAVCPGPVDTEFFGKALNGKPMDPFKRAVHGQDELCGGPGVFRLPEGKTGVRAGTFHESVLCAVPHLPPQPFNEISHMEIRGDGYVG